MSEQAKEYGPTWIPPLRTLRRGRSRQIMSASEVQSVRSMAQEGALLAEIARAVGYSIAECRRAVLGMPPYEQ